MKVLLIGRNGQVGRALEPCLAPLGELIALDRHSLDLANADQIVSVVRDIKPEVIINAAAYTAVDQAETESSLADAINAQAPGVLAQEAKKLGALLVHYSTDYVFDGTKPAPYVEDDTPNPLSAYGRSKHTGERAIQATDCRHIIFRTSWVYGVHGKNFLLTILRLARQKDELRVVDDQIGAPTSSDLIARTTATILSAKSDVGGLYHLCATGQTSWAGFAKLIITEARLQTRVAPIPSAEYPVAAKRPLNSRLATTKLTAETAIVLPDWTEDATHVLKRLLKATS